MIIYRPFEMHTHTVHSDGRFTLEQLCETAKSYGFEGIALTDHNTLSGFDGLPETPVICGIPVIRGIEWTTYFGHMQVLYAEKFVDWRYAVQDTVDEYIAQIKAAKGIVGVVHPFEMGSPMCTGCYFDFRVKNWDAVDYIEVLSKEDPTKRYETPFAVKMWTDLLNRGHHIAVTAGRDWHRDDRQKHSAATYIGLEEGAVSADSVRDAFANGRTYLTCGPRMDISLQQENRRYTIGQTVRPGSVALSVFLDREARRFYWGRFGIVPRELRVVMNGDPVRTAGCSENDRFDLEFSAEKGWFRLEVWGDALGEQDKLIGLSGAFYCAA